MDEKAINTGDLVSRHTQSNEAALESLQTRLETGLTRSEVQTRLIRNGPNELIDKGRRSALGILWEQLTATMVLILLSAALIAGFLGDLKNTAVICAIIVLFSLLGFIQEHRAEQAIAGLKKLSVPNVRVFRDGLVQEVPAREVVAGDIIHIEAGNILPADMRLIEAVNLRIQEAALTGESEPVEKQTAALQDEGLPLGDRTNMGYMGTIVTQGRGLGLVVETGMATELGKIANLIQKSEAGLTPLQKRLDALGLKLAVAGVGIALLIAVLGLMRGDELRHMLLTAVSIAVAIVPEGLPAVVTITLAIGGQRMLKKNVLIRKLPAVETLGSVTVICSDKTGTLTENKMTVVMMDVGDHALNLSEELKKNGSFAAFQCLGEPVQSALSLTAMGGALCNDARLVDEGGDRYHTIGDPTEGALVVAAAKIGYLKSALDSSFPRFTELPFDSERKRMTTVHVLPLDAPTILGCMERGNHRHIAFTKGSVDGLLKVSSQVWVNGTSLTMNEAYRQRIEDANDRLAHKGMRVLGIAFRLLNELPEKIETDLEQNLTFVGMFGMIDPPRKEVKTAIAMTKTAGIRTVMITGDHPLTAVEIARQLGIADARRVLNGTEIENISDDELKELVDETAVYARVSPEHKLKIVQALQENGHIVAMTGDGVNDAPALKRADIGVAMGITGTDVSKEAADMVLLDDNFASIVAAVKEGRTIFDNIRKFVHFSVAGNIGKVLVMLLAPFIGKPIPLLPLQLLWMNLLTDGLLGLGLVMEQPESDTMNRPPHSPEEGLFAGSVGTHAIAVGLLIGASALGLGSWYYFTECPEWQTMVFTFLVFAQVFKALASRSAKESMLGTGIIGNRFLSGMVILVIGLQLMVIYVPFLASFFNITALSAEDLLIALAASALVFLGMEAEKKIRRSYTQ